MPAGMQTRIGYAQRVKLLGKPLAYNIKQPKAYKKAAIPIGTATQMVR